MAPGETWPESGYDNRNSGTSDDNTGPVSGVSEDWRYQTGDGVQGSPAVDGDTAYVGNDAGTMYAFDRASGDKRWEFETGNYVYGAPAVHDGTVYCSSTDGTFYALASDDGTIEWTLADGNQYWASPTVVDGSLYVSNDSGLYALDLAGTKRWKTGFDADPGEPVATSEMVYVGTQSQRIHALSAETGERQWMHDLDGDATVSPGLALGANALYAGRSGESGRLVALGPDGSRRWAFETIDAIAVSPAVTDGGIYVATKSGFVIALHHDGTVAWRFEPFSGVITDPAVVSDTVYVADLAGYVYALSSVDGSKRWRMATDETISSSPAVADNRVYFGSTDGHVYALTGEAGKPGVKPPTTVTPPPETGSLTDVWPIAALAGAGGIGAWYGWNRLRERTPDEEQG